MLRVDLARTGRQLLLDVRERATHLQPELVVAAPFALVFVIGLLAGLPSNLPDGTSLLFVERHYFRPLVLALVVQALALLIRRTRTARGNGLSLRSGLWMAGLVGAAVLMHFNFKAWMPLVHRSRFDYELQITDSLFSGLVPSLIGARRELASLALDKAGLNVDSLYHGLFVGMFFASFCAHALFDEKSGLQRVTLGVSLVLLLGGVAYWAFPAKGPFIYRYVENQDSRTAQVAMEAMFDRVVTERRLPPGYFAAPLAAMPSLHTAHALLLTIFAWRRLRWLFFPFALALAWILVEAVATGWHYVLDLFAGALLAWVCVLCVDRLIK